jgi:hypothetical protein
LRASRSYKKKKGRRDGFKEAVAQKFMERFAGESFNPIERSRGAAEKSAPRAAIRGNYPVSRSGGEHIGFMPFPTPPIGLKRDSPIEAPYRSGF